LTEGRRLGPTGDDQPKRLAISGGRDRRRSGDLRFSGTDIGPGQRRCGRHTAMNSTAD